MGKKKKYTYAVDESKSHLGGNFVEGDPATFCPSAWNYIISKFNVKTVTDVGSGRGFAAKWFLEHNCKTIAIEGLHDNVVNAIVPTIEHDLTVSSHVTDSDFINCIEVVEHIEEKYLDNLLDTLCCGKLLLMTHAIPGQDGWHHVNCQESEYWIEKISSRGFTFLSDESKIIRDLALQDEAYHVSRNGMIFKNDNK